MPSDTLNIYEVFSENLAEKVHDLNSDTIMFALSNTAPDAASDATLSDAAELSDANGYTAADSGNSTSRSSGTTSVAFTSPVTFTASGGNIGPFQYLIVYNDTPTSPADPLIGYADYGSAVTLADGESLSVTGTNILTIG